MLEGFDFTPGEPAPLSGFKAFGGDGAHRNAAEMHDRMADTGAHAFDFAFSAFVEDQLELGPLFMGFEHTDP